MLYRYKIGLILLLSMAQMPLILSQQPEPSPSPVAFFDSIDRRITYLEDQVKRHKKNRDVKYLNFQRELDHTLFVKTYEQYVRNEELDQAKELVEANLKRSEFLKDLSSVKFYIQYQEKTYSLIKAQRMHYQQLFLKEKNFKKEYDTWVGSQTIGSYTKARRMIELALKYALENNLTATITLLKQYDSFTEALLFDLQSDFDLAELTNNAKSFNKVFLPMITSDSIQTIREAEKLLAHCMNYGRLTKSSLNNEFFKKQEMALTSSMAVLLDKQGREKELARYTDQSVIARRDTLNPCGVFKWHDQVVVIDEFIPASGMENVKKGEAIIHADRMLSTYLQKNKLCSSLNDLRFGYAFIIPFNTDAENVSFFFNEINKKWQYMACYTVIVNESYTSQISKFMPPLFFEDEMNTAEK